MFEATSQPRRAYDSYADAARGEVLESVPGGREFAAAQRRFGEAGDDAAQLKRVLDGLTAALAENPYLARAYLLRGQVLIKQGKARDALVELERAVVVNKYLRDAYIVRGYVYIRDLPEAEQTRQTTALAQEAFQTALLIEQRKGGEQAETHTGLAHVLFLQNDLLPAHKAADRAIELDASFAEAYRVRGMIRARQGNAAGAQQDQKKYDELKKQS
jgi:tetratricopeptide (TPR) repeat protein